MWTGSKCPDRYRGELKYIPEGFQKVYRGLAFQGVGSTTVLFHCKYYVPYSLFICTPQPPWDFTMSTATCGSGLRTISMVFPDSKLIFCMMISPHPALTAGTP